MNKPNEPILDDMTILDLKHGFVTAFAILQECPGAHTFIVSDEPNSPQPVALLVKGVIMYGASLVDAMGNDAFYLWLDRFLHATYQEKKAMWENEGQWHEER